MGNVVEGGDAREILDHPQHPCSILLKTSVLAPEVPYAGLPPLDHPGDPGFVTSLPQTQSVNTRAAKETESALCVK